jgi:cell wall-associated NlpC family hydrolase
MEKNNIYKVSAFTTDIMSEPVLNDVIDSNDSQLLYGEEVEVLKTHENFVYGRSVIDSYEGYILKSSLSPKKLPATHFIDCLLTHTYPRPSFKSKPHTPLSFLSRIHVASDNIRDGFIEIENGSWIFHHHIQPLSQLKEQDPLDTAMKFLGVPYLYGGRSSLGIDCSALIQLSLLRNGITPCPRDSKDQLVMLKDKKDQHSIGKGDLVFFPGHVGMMVDENNILNATARQMSVVIEPLERVKKDYKTITSIKELKLYSNS